MLLRAFGHLFDRIFIVVFALAAAQFPMFYAQYTNTVAGAEAEAHARYDELERSAAQVQLSVDQFIEHHRDSNDPAFHASGEIHRNTVTRYRRLEAVLGRLRTAQPWEKPVVIAQVWDREIVTATRFEPGLPLTTEGLIYGLAGLILAALLGAGTRGVYGRAASRSW